MYSIKEALIKDASKLKATLALDKTYLAQNFLRDNKCLISNDYNSLASYSFINSTSVFISFYGSNSSLFIDSILKYLFFKKSVYKVNVIVSLEEDKLEKLLVENGFVQEAILHDQIEKNGEYKDAGLFYITAPMLLTYNVGFIPFQRGVIAIKGGIDFVDEVSFLGFSKPIEDRFTRLCADYCGFTKDGLLLPRGHENYEHYSTDGLPSEVIRAITQIREYLKKERTVFDVVIKLPESSSFRMDVWNEIKKIPFGDTKSYEDIALALSNNDKVKARKLTRAVGHACSENPVPIIIPCHRVIGKDGKLVGFKDGVEFKDFLLTHELFAALPLC